jgi:GH24 family phage-related lysozyme (muramidase)
MPTLTRTIKTPDSYSGERIGRSSLLDKIYVGFVKDTKDINRLGRLRVYIPEISGDPADENGWYTVSYASPFAGATSAYANTQGDKYTDSQRSYGMWFVPPDIDNEVMCCFINGDPGRGFWFACLYQERMNHMVPGIPGNDSKPGEPVGEYNKAKPTVDPDKPNRPRYAPLADQLAKQGLDRDDLRGTSSSGARRDEPINSVYGLLTPGGSQIVFDDNPTNKFIRLRTQLGAQVLISDTTGCVYINSKDGKNWIELSNNGQIDIYASTDISIRSESSVNIRADLDVNIEAGRNIYMKARADDDIPDARNGGLLIMNANAAIHQYSNGSIFSTAKGDQNRTAGGDIYDYCNGDANYKANNSVAIQADDDDVDIKAGGEIHATATNIHLNSVVGDDATAGDDAFVRQDTQLQDRRMESETTFKTLMRNTIVYNLPHHEPFGHGGISAATKSDGKATDPRSDPDTRLTRSGEIVAGQDKPTDIAGTPRPGMREGQYRGVGYDDNGNPKYEYVGALEGLNPANSYRLSTRGKDHLKKTEGKAYVKYQDPPGQTKTYSIGYGRQLSPQELAGNYVVIGGERISLDKALSQAQIEKLFDETIGQYEDAVRSAIKTKLTQDQFDALVSFCYNIGSGGFKGSELVKIINAGDYQRVPFGFMQWKTPKSLIGRRQKEIAWFMAGTSGNDAKATVTAGNTKPLTSTATTNE